MLNRFIPIDKSSAIRAFLFSLMTGENVEVICRGKLPEDVETALNCLKLFGKNVENSGSSFKISGNVSQPCTAVDCGNSATVMHVLMGISQYLGFGLQLTGDESLMSRSHDDFYKAAELYDGNFVETALTKESAQLKSFHLISMLRAGGKLHFKSATRRNTEDILLKMGANLIENRDSVEIFPAKKLHGYSVEVKKDPSAAFIAACTSLVYKKSFVISNIYLDESRMQPFILLKNAGFDAGFRVENGSFTVSGTPELCGTGRDIEIDEIQVPAVIDEIPFLAFMAASAGRNFTVKNAEWLRNKESDRIKESVRRLSVLFETEEFEDGFAVYGMKKNPEKPLFPHSSDHRMEMLSFLMSKYCGINFKMNDSYRISFPLFYELAEFLEKDGR